MNLYLDNAATTPLTDEVKEYIISILDIYGNPSSTHEIGHRAKQIIQTARNNVAKFINCEPQNIIFTSSGSASNNLAILGLNNSNNHVFYSPIAHKSMTLCCERFENRTKLKVNRFGEIDLKQLEEMLECADKQPVVCIDMANSEIGTIQNASMIAKIVHKYNGIVICDATGYIPYYKVDTKFLDADIITFSGHKLHAPKGVGILYKKSNIELFPIIYGAQEQGLFGGTENIIGIGALGKALENYEYNCNSFNRDYIWKNLSKTENIYLVGSKEHRLPNNLYICFQGVSGSSLQALLDMHGIQVSTGSACNSGEQTPSKTLVEIGMSKDDLHSCIRITLSGKETVEEMNYLCDKVNETVKQLREFA